MTASILKGRNSSAALAKLLAAPVILVIDTLGMTRGIAPLVLGYQAFDRETNIAGIILNKVGTAPPAGQNPPGAGALHGHPRDWRRAAQQGFRDRPSAISGLMTPSETPELRARIARLRAAVEDGVDLDRLV